MKKVDIIILSGFLGSGKTTILQNFLEEEHKAGRKVAVLMNEIGEYSVDSDIIGGSKTRLKELLNGCICCTIKDQLELSLLSLIQMDHPDIIYIESTGLAHPIDVMDACLSPILAPSINIQSIITIVDSNRWLSREEYPKAVNLLMIEQIKHANYVILNKTDMVPFRKLDEIEQAILNPAAIFKRTFYASLSPRDIKNFKREATDAYQKVHVHNQLKIKSMTYSFTHELNQDAFEEWLKQLPRSIYRIKGFVPFIDGELILVQYNYGVAQYYKQEMSFPKNLVIIGEDLMVRALKEQLKNLESKC